MEYSRRSKVYVANGNSAVVMGLEMRTKWEINAALLWLQEVIEVTVDFAGRVKVLNVDGIFCNRIRLRLLV